ncbi:terminase large subunit domain-containing protein [Maritimibacter fusiformis]|uniref:Uncharacterized protein n=1 Tax=Maritimibacter fusiformis TaxID=2603819 RepID=A0A5D0RNG1_9RHOB|nr:terminase family protein [Maritimibacter fusiformis]TYB83120.1 hypothetical protein FVF75_02760 [Maritimibacter fusiformis]
MTTPLTLNYKPRSCFLEAHRLIALKSTTALHIGASRRLGKTVFVSAIAAMRALVSTSDIAFIAPTLTQALNVGWRNVLDRLRDVPGLVVKKGEALIEVPAADGGTSTIRFFAGVDDGGAGGVRGYGFDLVIIDEVAQVGSDVYLNAILPTMSGRPNAQLITIGTFRSVDLMYQLHEDIDLAQGEHTITLPASTAGVEAGVFTLQELLAVADKMGGWGKPAFQREYEANRFVTDEEAIIDQALVRAAQERRHSEAMIRQLVQAYPVVVGCDPAPTSDRTIIVVRAGPAILRHVVMQAPTVQEIAHKLLATVREYDADALFIDNGAGGQGPAVMDICRSIGLNPVGVDFGGRPTTESDAYAYANRRAELISAVKTWTERSDCSIPPGEDILREMSAPRYEINSQNRLQVESKKAIRKRIGMSTDFLDALACTMATSALLDREEAVYTVRPRSPDGSRYQTDFEGLKHHRDGFVVLDEVFEPHNTNW